MSNRPRSRPGGCIGHPEVDCDAGRDPHCALARSMAEGDPSTPVTENPCDA
ncbi:hypothetical protein I545_6979 [Mycobacterium kansasii 662]|uniref:Uncharacterized protein n=1 Tax=Mycobacterium kansasii 662 TaxID=1299326 RepID=X7XNP9_MYCKA|nr:hypothetical protein I545_6979 [Mycobacterium kansasii 662]